MRKVVVVQGKDSSRRAQSPDLHLGLARPGTAGPRNLDHVLKHVTPLDKHHYKGGVI